MTGEIRKQIKQALAERGMSQVELARLSGIREDYVSKILRGERVSVPKDFAAILDTLNFQLFAVAKSDTKEFSLKLQPPEFVNSGLS